MAKTAAGIILYRMNNGTPEVLLVHPGGPFWNRKDEGCWSIPKGQADNGERGDDLLDVAKREFEEETGFPAPAGPYVYVGEVVRERDKKSVRAWRCEGSIDTSRLQSSFVEVEWPPKSGRMIKVPEVDRGAFFPLEEARKKLSSYMLPLLELFEKQMIQ